MPMEEAEQDHEENTDHEKNWTVQMALFPSNPATGG